VLSVSQIFINATNHFNVFKNEIVQYCWQHNVVHHDAIKNFQPILFIDPVSAIVTLQQQQFETGV